MAHRHYLNDARALRVAPTDRRMYGRRESREWSPGGNYRPNGRCPMIPRLQEARRISDARHIIRGYPPCTTPALTSRCVALCLTSIIPTNTFTKGLTAHRSKSEMAQSMRSWAEGTSHHRKRTGVCLISSSAVDSSSRPPMRFGVFWMPRLRTHQRYLRPPI